MVVSTLPIRPCASPRPAACWLGPLGVETMPRHLHLTRLRREGMVGRSCQVSIQQVAAARRA